MPKTEKPKILVVILARGGSKEIPGKNIRPLLGIPLIAYTISEALRSKYLSRLIVSSDNDKIRDISIKYGAEAPFKRPVHLATDKATSIDALIHAVDWIEKEEGFTYDYVVELLCTSPLKRVEDIDNCINKLISTGADSVIGVTKLEDHHPIRVKKIVNDKIEDFCLKEIPGTHRQDLKPDAYIRNGTIYASKRDRLAFRVGYSNSRPYIMPLERSVNIDTELDFLLAEILLKKYSSDYVKPIQCNRIKKDLTIASSITPSKLTKVERRVLITTVPFADVDRLPLDILERNGVEYTLNPYDRPPTEDELCRLIGDYGILLAGSSPITERVMDNAPNLKLIARAGVGVDNIDLKAAHDRKIHVTYTPNAPSPAVAEFTVGLMLSMCRFIHQANKNMRDGNWKRLVGWRIANQTVGLIGMGLIGKSVVKLLSGFAPRILVNDLELKKDSSLNDSVTWVNKETIYRECDIISLHLPLTSKTRHIISSNELSMMKQNAILVNTARGGLVNEQALQEALRNKSIGGAALDVFEEEPYKGILSSEERCLLTSHMASASVDCKTTIEKEAVAEIKRFLNQESLDYPVPIECYTDN